jgi:hypothetical protein
MFDGLASAAHFWAWEVGNPVMGMKLSNVCNQTANIYHGSKERTVERLQFPLVVHNPLSRRQFDEKKKRNHRND